MTIIIHKPCIVPNIILKKITLTCLTKVIKKCIIKRDQFYSPSPYVTKDFGSGVHVFHDLEGLFSVITYLYLLLYFIHKMHHEAINRSARFSALHHHMTQISSIRASYQQIISRPVYLTYQFLS